MFNITKNKGFHITFANGWTVSVQWGAGNYGDNYGLSVFDYLDQSVPPSKLAEVAAWKDGDWFKFENGDTVNGYINSDEVFDFMAKIKAL